MIHVEHPAANRADDPAELLLHALHLATPLECYEDRRECLGEGHRHREFFVLLSRPCQSRVITSDKAERHRSLAGLAEETSNHEKPAADNLLAAYRELVRRQLDAEVAEFDPHVVHCLHLSVEAQLALETGVPYVVSVGASDWAAAGRDPRARRLVQQAAENASLVLTASEAVAEQLAAAVDELGERLHVLALPDDAADPAWDLAVAALVELYVGVWEARFGQPPV
jgi:hypothetical protein